MMKRKLAALLAAVLLGTAAVPTTVVFAQGNDPDAAAVTDAAETKAQTDEEQAGETAEVTESGGEISEEEALSEVAKLLTGNPDFFSTVIGDLDPETLEILMKNPKLLGYFLPTLHVTVTDGTVKIDYKDQETEETILTGTVTTNGSNLNVRTGPGIGYDIISSLANGSQIKVLGEKDGWYQIEFPADIAYVCGQYVRLNEVATAETPEGYSFDITGTDMAAFLSAFSSLFGYIGCINYAAVARKRRVVDSSNEVGIFNFLRDIFQHLGKGLLIKLRKGHWLTCHFIKVDMQMIKQCSTCIEKRFAKIFI